MLLQNVRAALFKTQADPSEHKQKKITVVGVGQVGMAAAVSILHKVSTSITPSFLPSPPSSFSSHTPIGDSAGACSC